MINPLFLARAMPDWLELRRIYKEEGEYGLWAELTIRYLNDISLEDSIRVTTELSWEDMLLEVEKHFTKMFLYTNE